MWTQSPDGRPVAEASTSQSPIPDDLPSPQDGIRSLDSATGRVLVAAVPGPRRAWLVLGPCGTAAADLESYMRFMLPVVSQYLQSALEVEHAADLQRVSGLGIVTLVPVQRL